MMLYFISLGLCKEQITLEAFSALKNSDKVYLEAYTSNYSDNSLKHIEKELNINFIKMYRDDSEQNFYKIVNEAKNKNVAFCVFGNITSATTHNSIINECKEKKIKYKLIPGISIFTIAHMLSKLEEYRFGRTISIVKPEENYYPKSFFNYIVENKTINLHTLCLLDIKIDTKKEYYMQPFEAAELLLNIAKENNLDYNNEKVIVISGASSKKEKVYLTNLKKLSKIKTNYKYPSCLILFGKLTEYEKENISDLDLV